jgi:hypothetical protein
MDGKIHEKWMMGQMDGKLHEKGPQRLLIYVIKVIVRNLCQF